MPYNNSAIPPRRDGRDATGTPQLPMSRIKKMIMVDQDIQVCATSAAFTIAIATASNHDEQARGCKSDKYPQEMFIQYMAEQGHNVVKSERKPRRNIQYRDLSNAVSRLDNLEFLTDIVPKTIPFKAAKATKAPAAGSTAINTSLPQNGLALMPSSTLSPATSANIAAHTANASRTYESPFAPNGGIINDFAPVNGFVNSNNKSNRVVSGTRRECLNEDDEDPNTQLEMECRGTSMRRRSSGVNSERLKDIEMS
ncbi:hypothetical protein BJ875DRAFT_486538 [Amylocarpus encephaloides]|uniref:Transcription factor CBF/NF-Y/archaeal histone domain-containing protein n=1 Tax=Amylocarpus encephaloides TaxID=45428 RepID=A0A9P8C4E6_9HELO|nr:hypothetical protein BJ875DRAFT_486538 [Amylocarpus encephaloides]